MTTSVAISCVLCHGETMRDMRRGVRYALELHVKACAGCGLVFLWPRPDAAGLAHYYRTEYRAEYDATVSPDAMYLRERDEAHARVARLRADLTPATRVLEVGASVGTFLEAVRPHVDSVLGVEPGDSYRAWAKRTLDVPMVTDIAELGPGEFDVIALFQTLEHVADPIAYLQTLAGHLAPGGRMMIEVPNVDDALVALYAVPAFVAQYYQRAHLYYFSAETLGRAVAAAGGRGDVVGVQRYDLSNHIRWMLTGQGGGHGHYADTFGDRVQEQYAAALIRAGHADTLWMVATFGRSR
jgi:2-polyprenyl-3-methyl-5-hydroxy-6-metoxy-1,4-benzoquinol methylase